LRNNTWQHQRTLYSILTHCSWETVQTFTRNDPQLQGTAGATTVLHTHSRRLDYHPHIHLVMPAAAIEPEKRLWRTKRHKAGQGTNSSKSFLFSHKALAKVFRAKMLEAICQAGLDLPTTYPEKWVVDVQSVGSSEKALIYLGRYLYRGVLQEKDILACQDGQVTFRYRDSKTKKMRTHTLPGAQFLWLILQHVLPKGFRRARNFGFLHPNSKRLIAVLQYLFGLNPKKAAAELEKRPQLTCRCCGAAMKVVKTRIPRAFVFAIPLPAG
jgi:Putative transposase